MHASPSFTFALALGIGVACQLVARHLRIPSIVLLLAAGVLVGPDFWGWIDPQVLGRDGLFGLVSLAVAIILFEGGLNLDLSALRRAATPVRRLVTLGAAVTGLGGAVAAHFFMGWGDLRLALLFGTLVIVTGPTVIRPLLRNVPLRPRLATVLEAEGLLIDPVGAIVAGVALQLVVLDPELGHLTSGAADLAARTAFGAAAGLIFGLMLVGLLRIPRAVPEGLENLVALGGALVAFEVCEALLSESGILAVTVAGVVVGNMERRIARELGEFQEHLTVGLIGLLFVLLAADVRMADVLGLGMPGLLTVAALTLVVRPLNVWLCTLGSDLSWRERAFLGWVGPRGVVAAAIASLAAGFLEEMGFADAASIRALVFLTIAVTVILQGGTAPLVARMLGVRAPGREALVVLGAEELAFAFVEALGTEKENVLFTDSNPLHCRAAETRGFRVVWGNALEERTVARMRLERARAVVGLTPNNEVNHHFAGEAMAEYGVPASYAAIGRESSEVATRIVHKQEGRVLFDGPKDVERWNVRFRHGDAQIVELEYLKPSNEPPAAAPIRPGDPDPYLILGMKRADRVEPMFEEWVAAEGDIALVALYVPERAAALERLSARGFWPALPREEDEETNSG
ncbi:MAG: sodium:proton antiporter [Deltaproteobacteria bacterium]|nr:sodium:proton antiporter [Deltaproteobacteria bacterium]